VYRHKLGDPQSKDELLYTEPDDGFFLGVSLTDTGNWIVIDASDHDTSEARLVSASGDAGSKPLLVQERQVGVKYDVSDFEDHLIILTNEGGATDFKVATPTSHCRQHLLSRTAFAEDARLFSRGCFLARRIVLGFSVPSSTSHISPFACAV
jgi:protease II